MMKLINIACATFLLFLFSCDKLPENGELDGQWQLMQVEEFSDDSQTPPSVESKKESRIYWAFQLDLLNIYTQLGSLNGHTPNTMARFQHQNGRLEIPELYIHFHDRDSLLTDPNTQVLNFTGIRGNRAFFKVEKLDRKSMILSSEFNRLTFRRF